MKPAETAKTHRNPSPQAPCAACGNLSDAPPASPSSAELSETTLKITTALAAIQKVLEDRGTLLDAPSCSLPGQQGADLGDSPEPQGCEVLSRLTPREREILRHVALGNSNRKVAKVLGIAEKTVKNHLCAIFLKMGVSGRTEAVVLGIRGGIITFEGGPADLPS